MAAAPALLDADVFATLPSSLHHRGEPTEWVRLTRPGMRLSSFLEGPCFDRDGNLWCVDVPYGRIFLVDEAGRWTLAHQGDGEPHGLAWLDAHALAVTDNRLGLMRFDTRTSTMTTLCEAPDGDRFLGLNDVARAPDGDLWFTDPGRSSLSDPTGRLFRWRVGHASPRIVLANLAYPNGVALSPDGTQVYVAVTRANAILRLQADGPDPVPMVGLWVQLSGGLGPDGIDVHPRGHVAVAHARAGRALVVDPIGDPLAQVRTPGGTWTTSVAWHPDGRRLFIVDAETASIYSADLATLFP